MFSIMLYCFRSKDVRAKISWRDQIIHIRHMICYISDKLSDELLKNEQKEEYQHWLAHMYTCTRGVMAPSLKKVMNTITQSLNYRR